MSEARHLLDKVAFGGTYALSNGQSYELSNGQSYELAQYGVSQGLNALVEQLLATNDDSHCESRARAAIGNKPEQSWNVTDAKYYWLTHMVCSPNPFKERMAIFWHNYFATNLADNGGSGTNPTSYIVYEHLNGVPDSTFHGGIRGFGVRSRVFGTLSDLLKGYTQDRAGALGALHLTLNTYAETNEDYPREILELFSMGDRDRITGQPNYTEVDITGILDPQTNRRTGGSARALAGATIVNNRFNFDPSRWMPNPSAPESIQVFQGSACQASLPFNWETFIDHLTSNCPQVPRYLAYRLIAELTYLEPSAAVVQELANDLVASGMQVVPALRKLLKSNLMFSQQSRNTCIASPVDVFIKFFRAFNLPLQGNAMYSNFVESLRRIDFNLLQPSTVFGWKLCGVKRNTGFSIGESFANLQPRLDYSRQFVSLLSNVDSNGFTWNSPELIPSLSATPGEIVDHMAYRLGVNLLPEQRQVMVTYLTTTYSSTGSVNQISNWNAQNQQLVRLKIPGLLQLFISHFDSNLH